MAPVPTSIPPALHSILDRPALCVGEDRSQYEELRNLIMDEIKPVTVSEYLLANDIAAAEWELLRLYGFKSGMINVRVLAKLEEYHFSHSKIKSAVKAAKYDEEMRSEVQVLAEQALDGDHGARAKLLKWLNENRLAPQHLLRRP